MTVLCYRSRGRLEPAQDAAVRRPLEGKVGQPLEEPSALPQRVEQEALLARQEAGAVPTRAAAAVPLKLPLHFPVRQQ